MNNLLKLILALCICSISSVFAQKDLQKKLEANLQQICPSATYLSLGYSSSSWKFNPSDQDDPAIIPLIFEDPKFISDGRGIMSSVERLKELQQELSGTHQENEIKKKMENLQMSMERRALKSAPRFMSVCKEYYSKVALDCSKLLKQPEKFKICIAQSGEVLGNALAGYVYHSHLTSGKANFKEITLTRFLNGIELDKKFDSDFERIGKSCINTLYDIALLEAKSTSVQKLKFKSKHSGKPFIFSDLAAKINSKYAISIKDNKEVYKHFDRKLKIGFMWENFPDFMGKCVAANSSTNSYPDNKFIQALVGKDGYLELSKMNAYFDTTKP